MKFIIALIAVLSFSVQAQPYAGGSIGYGSTVADGLEARPYHDISINRKQESEVVGAFVGYRSGRVAVEGGFMMLPGYRGEADTQNYPAYKGCALGPTCPQTARVTQEIFSRALYLRGNVYGPRLAGFEPYAFAGVAKTFTYNHEYGNYGAEKVDFKVDFQNTAGLYGLGVQKNITQRTAVRAEYFEIPKHADEEHTLQRTARMFVVGLVVKL